MASSKGQVTLRGRFSPGDVVTLTKVAGPHVLRPEGGEELETQTVGEEKDVPRVGYVRFSKGVEVGARYFIHGLTDGVPTQVRITGRAADDPNEVFEQPPILPDRVRLTDGRFADEAPTKESPPNVSVGPADIRHASKGTVLRSDTPRGEAHPVDVERQEPMRRQEDVNGPVQMSDTETGEAAELILGPQRQEDVPKGVVQRSSTPTGVATPLPAGDQVQQAEDRESSQARESRGEPGQAAAAPLDGKGIKTGAPTGATKKQSEDRDAELKKSENDAAELEVPLADIAPSAGEDGPVEAKPKRKPARKRKPKAKKKPAAKKQSAQSEPSSKPGPTTGAATTTSITASKEN